MTLIKSLLLGSAAGIVAIASAQAADLPTRKGAPAVQYVKVCTITVAGKPIAGFTLPGSDTCMHFTGYITGQVETGNLETGYSYGSYANGAATAGTTTTATTVTPATVTPGVGVTRTGAQTVTAPATRAEWGYTNRLNFGADVASNTAAGPLEGHLEIQIENGSGFDSTNTGAYTNLAYLTWAGITAGKAPSFFSFTGGGPGWANFFSPDQKGFNQPDLLAYTASFGGGFSATLAAQSAGPNSPGFAAAATAGSQGGWGASGGGTYNGVVDGTYLGQDAPDIVLALALSQAWGSAQVSGVAHEVHAQNGWTFNDTSKWGWALDAGISINLPSFGAGDDILVTGAWSQNASWYSGLSDAMWGENGAVNGNGQAMFLADIAGNSDGTWSTPTAWSITAELDHHFNPQLEFSLEGSVGGVSWSNQIATSDVSNSTSWLIGGVGNWVPVTNLTFTLEVLYQSTQTDAPNSAVTAPWHKDADGVAGRFYITRAW
jgi:hypothetical protein